MRDSKSISISLGSSLRRYQASSSSLVVFAGLGAVVLGAVAGTDTLGSALDFVPAVTSLASESGETAKILAAVRGEIGPDGGVLPVAAPEGEGSCKERS